MLLPDQEDKIYIVMESEDELPNPDSWYILKGQYKKIGKVRGARARRKKHD